MDGGENDRAEGSPAEPEGSPQDEIEMAKERETKEDGRYIIFYSFGDEEAEGG